MSDRDDATKSQRSDGGLRSPSRQLVLGGIPVAVTLASKPALAMTGECSVLNALSSNLSHPLPEGTNCGLTPESWIKLAGTEQLWTRTGFAPDDSLERADEIAPVRWIVFPRWRVGDAARFTPFSKAASLIEIGHHAMNYSLHGAQGFALLSKILEKSHCYRFADGDLNETASAFDALAAAA